MNVRLLHTAVGLSLAGLIAVTGCSKDNNDDDMTVKDTGTNTDTGTPDSGETPDTGTPDSGRPDMGVVDPCPDGTEGCECNSTLGMNDTAFKQDDCDTGLLCMPWDAIAGQQDNVTSKVHSCVKPCTADAECGAGRFCAPTSLSGPNAPTGAERVCVDRLSGLDEYCHLSRSRLSSLAMVDVELPGIMAGCADGRVCSPGGAAGVDTDVAISFSDVHPDNGICMTLCRDQAGCASLTGMNYCNPVYGSQTSTQTIGVCSIQQLNQIGAICGAVAPGNPGSTGLSNGCDAAANLACLGVMGLFPSGTGFCGQFCSNTEPCTATEPAGQPYTCTAAPGNNPTGDGLCVFGDADVFPDNCDGPGSHDVGRQELTLQYDANTPLPLCIDRLADPLDFTVLTPDGSQIAINGGDCGSPNDDFSWAKCREGSFCLDITGAGDNRCLVGCTRTPTTAAGPQGGCAVVSATSTCAPFFVDETVGACGDM